MSQKCLFHKTSDMNNSKIPDPLFLNILRKPPNNMTAPGLITFSFDERVV